MPYLLPTSAFNKKAFLLLAFILISTITIIAQKTWTGNSSAAWNDINNWSPVGFPLATEDVIIPMISGPSASDPIISSPAVAQSIFIDPGGNLTVNNTLTIANSSGIGLENEGTLTNSTIGEIIINNTNLTGLVNRSILTNDGKIKIGELGGANNVTVGISNFGNLINNTGGLIQTDNHQNDGISNSTTGNFTNKGLINIGLFGNSGSGTNQGITNAGTMTNTQNSKIEIDRVNVALFNSIGTFTLSDSLIIGQSVGVNGGITNNKDIVVSSTGVIQMDNIANDGIINKQSATITNDGHINIGTDGPVMGNGIDNSAQATISNNNRITIGSMITAISMIGFNNMGDAELNNNSNGILQIDNTGSHGIEHSSTSTLDNDGEIKIGTTGLQDNIGSNGIRSTGTINNMAGGQINIREASRSGIAQFTTGAITNGGLLNIQNTGDQGIFSTGSITNDLNATIIINNTSKQGITNGDTASIIINNGSILIGSISPVLTGILSGGILTNGSTGIIQIDRCNTDGLVNFNMLTNNGHISIATIGSVLRDGINNNSSVFINSNTITIGGGGIVRDGIQNLNGASFNNNPCANLFLNDNLNNISNNAIAFVNEGYIELNTTEVHVPGTFINSGMINDIQGTFPTGAAGFTNNNILIAPTLDVFCDLAIIPDAFVYGGSSPYMVDNNIYSDANATVIAGSYDAMANEFTPIVPLMPNSAYTFFVKLSDVSNSCPDVVVEWQVSTSDDITIAPTTVYCDLSVIPDAFDLIDFDSSMVAGVFIDANAMTSAGSYDSLTNVFTPTTPLMPNSSYTFYVKVDVVNVPCTFVIVEWQVSTSDDITIAPTTVYCDLSVIPDAFDLIDFDSSMVAGVFIDANAMTSAGSYDALTNVFTPTAPLMPNSSYTLYVKINIVNAPCAFVIVEWSVTTTSDIITFDGGGDGVDWHDPLNWDHNIVPRYCHHVIIPALYTVKVYNNSLTGKGKTLDVNLFAGFETLPGGLLDIQN